MPRKALLVYVSGAPGSGKTTLAEKLSKELYIPHVSSDLIHGGARLTLGKANDRKRSLQEGFVPLLVVLAKSGISSVVDHVLQRNMSEEDIIAKIKPYAKIVYIHTKAKDPIDRFYKREVSRNDRGLVLDESALDARRVFHKDNLSATNEPLDLGLPVLEVDTTDGYTPTFSEVVAFIENEYDKEMKL